MWNFGLLLIISGISFIPWFLLIFHRKTCCSISNWLYHLLIFLKGHKLKSTRPISRNDHLEESFIILKENIHCSEFQYLCCLTLRNLKHMLQSYQAIQKYCWWICKWILSFLFLFQSLNGSNDYAISILLWRWKYIPLESKKSDD